MIRCSACGTEHKPSTKFCYECGAALPPEPVSDDDRTVLLPPHASRTPGTIEQAMGLSAAPQKTDGRSQPAAPDNDMTVILPKKAPRPSYEPAPPTVTGPLTEPLPPKKPSGKGKAGRSSSATTAVVGKPKTPIAMVLVLLAIAGGSAGYLGWLMLKPNKVSVPVERTAAAPTATQPAAPAPAKPAPVAEPSPPPQPAVAPAPAEPAKPESPPAKPDLAAAAAVAAPSELPPKATVATTSPAEPGTSAPLTVKPPVKPPKTEPPKTEPSKTEKAKAERLKNEQARLDAAKQEKQKSSGAAPKREAVGSADSARAGGAPAAQPPQPEASPVEQLRDELRGCDARSVFSREFCKQQARQRRCAGMWDKVAECPYKKDERPF